MAIQPPQNFVDLVGPVMGAAWLNPVDKLLNLVFEYSATKPLARASLTADAAFEVSNGGTGARSGTNLAFYSLDTGVVNAYSVNPVALPNPLVVGLLIHFIPLTPNTGPSTLTTPAGIAAIINQLGAALTGGELQGPLWVQWTGAAWRLVTGVTATTIGQLLYPRTAAEVAAGVVPSSFLYPAGDLRRYGAVLNGIANDATPVTSAFAQAAQTGGAPVFHPGGTALIGSALTIPSNILIYGANKVTCIFKKGFNGDLFSWGSNSGIRDVTIDGDKATRTGRSATIAAGTVGQYSENCAWINSAGYAVEYLGQDPGASSYFLSCDFNPTNIANGVCIKYPALQDSQAVPRSIINCHGGGAYIVDFAASTDSYFIGNFTNGMIWSSSLAGHSFIVGNRIALNGATLTIKGAEQIFTGNGIAGPITFDNTTVSCVFSGNAPGSGWFTISDSGVGNYIDVKQVGYTPVFSAGGGGAAIGNGTIVGQFSRSGSHVSVDIDFQPGSTTTFGTGAFQFTLPAVLPGFVPGGTQFMVGHADLFDASANTHFAGMVTSNPALALVTLTADNAVGNVTATVPFTWANGDRLMLHVEYYTA